MNLQHSTAQHTHRFAGSSDSDCHFTRCHRSDFVKLSKSSRETFPSNPSGRWLECRQRLPPRPPSIDIKSPTLFHFLHTPHSTFAPSNGRILSSCSFARSFIATMCCARVCVKHNAPGFRVLLIRSSSRPRLGKPSQSFIKEREKAGKQAKREPPGAAFLSSSPPS